MIIYTTNIPAALLILAVWCIDLYLLLAGVRFVLSRMNTTQTNGLCLTLQRFTDPIPTALHRRLMRRRTVPIPKWLPWLIVILGGLILRHLLIWTIFKIH